MGPIHMRYKLCVIMYGGGRAMWYPGRGSFLLGSAVVGDGAVCMSVHLASVGCLNLGSRF